MVWTFPIGEEFNNSECGILPKFKFALADGESFKGLVNHVFLVDDFFSGVMMA